MKMIVMIFMLSALTGCLTAMTCDRVGQMHEYAYSVRLVSADEAETVVERESLAWTQRLLFSSIFDGPYRRTDRLLLKKKRQSEGVRPGEDCYCIILDDDATPFGRYERDLWRYEKNLIAQKRMNRSDYDKGIVPDENLVIRMPRYEYEAFVRNPVVVPTDSNYCSNIGELKCVYETKQTDDRTYFVFVGTYEDHYWTRVPIKEVPQNGSWGDMTDIGRGKRSSSIGTEISRLIHYCVTIPLDIILLPIEVSAVL